MVLVVAWHITDVLMLSWNWLSVDAGNQNDLPRGLELPQITLRHRCVGIDAGRLILSGGHADFIGNGRIQTALDIGARRRFYLESPTPGGVTADPWNRAGFISLHCTPGWNTG